MKRVCALVGALWCSALLPALAAGAELKVGVARVDLTPAPGEMAAPFTVVHDRTYARALVLDNGRARAAIVVLDVPAMDADIFAEMSRRIAREADVPSAHVLLSVTHTHSLMRVAKDGMGQSLAGSQKFADHVRVATTEAVRQAVTAMRPARAGYAAGSAYLNASRNVWSVQQHRYIEGADRTGTQVVDRTLGVFKFETPTGQPIAFLLNYGIEPVVNISSTGEVSGDVPGATSRYIEERFDDKVVALFTIGSIASPAYRVRPDDGVPGHRDPEAAHRLLTAMGTLLGEEALTTAREIKATGVIDIGGAMKTVTCPGKITTPLNLPSQCAYTPDAQLPACVFKDQDTAPVDLGMGLLKLGDVALVEADANVLPTLGEKLKRASPLAHTVIVALNYGPVKYVLDDASYPLNIYEATATRVKQGCVEQGFIDGALEMLQRLR
jgi:hypothetical protein